MSDKTEIVNTPWHQRPIMIPLVGMLLIVIMCGFRWGPDNSSAEPATPMVTTSHSATPPLVAPSPVIVERRRPEPNRGILINGNDNELHFYDGPPTIRELADTRRRRYNRHSVVILERK